jgi:gamma-glutamyltranspeptidase / glutathione hydrolase
VIEGTEIYASRGVVATGPAEAARVGAAMFERGGNAMDAAAAACLACAVLEAQAVDLGGYVAAGVVLEGATGRVWSLDSNSVAPAAAREDMFEVLPIREGPRGINEQEYACSVRDDANVYGPLAAGVPGFVAGVGTLWERWGRLAWPDVVAPARRLVEGGVDYTLMRADAVKKREPLGRYAAAWNPADVAATLGRLGKAGWRDFYDGELGRQIADFVVESGGILTRADMAAFSPRVTEPYRSGSVYTAIPPNGGFSALDALQAFDADSEPDYWARWACVLSPVWARRLERPGAGASKHGTVHVAAADSEGNLVSMTISQGGLFGSCFAIPGTGIILGHGMCRFDPHAGHPNAPGPGKRPLNNVCPMIFRLPDRDVAIGARGGRRIVSVAAQFAQRIVAGATVREAAVAPRLHILDDGPLEISKNFDPAARAALEARGYRVEVPDEVAGAAHGAEILKHNGGLRAGGKSLRAGGNTWAAGV